MLHFTCFNWNFMSLKTNDKNIRACVWVINIFLSLISAASNPSCEVALLVRRGTSVEAARGQRTTLRCPVEHCGQSVKVNWCKECNRCGGITLTENLEITQTSSSKNRLLSSLTFKRISSDDAGLYKCCVTDDQNEEISHAIKVKVSGMLDLKPELQHDGF